MEKKFPEKRWVRFPKRTHREGYFRGICHLLTAFMPCFSSVGVDFDSLWGLGMGCGEGYEILESKRSVCCVPLVRDSNRS
jgi:hypothetical protein